MYGDAVTTANNILASEQMYRLGFVADLLTLVAGTLVSLIFYILFKPVNRNLSLLALIFSITAGAVMAANLIHQFASLLLLHNTVTKAHLQLNSYRHFRCSFSISNLKVITSVFYYSPSIFRLSDILFISLIFFREFWVLFTPLQALVI